MHRYKSAKMAKWLFLCQIAIFVLLTQSINFISNDFLLSILRDILHNLAKRVSQALFSAVHVLIQEDELSISTFPHRISKILFVLDSWGHCVRLRCGIGECSFFCCYIIRKKHSVDCFEFCQDYTDFVVFLKATQLF